MDKKVKLVVIGAFDPPTYGHLRLLGEREKKRFVYGSLRKPTIFAEKAKEFLEKEKGVQVVEGIMSLIPDSFRHKTCTASSYHRMKMLKRALQSSRWIRQVICLFIYLCL